MMACSAAACSTVTCSTVACSSAAFSTMTFSTIIFSTMTTGSVRNSGSAIVERLRNTRLERLGDIGRHFLSERREFLGLRRHHLEMLARMRGRQFKEFRHGFYRQHGVGVVQG